MGLFWDLIQQSQISDQREKSDDLNTRVRLLEGELRRTQRPAGNHGGALAPRSVT